MKELNNIIKSNVIPVVQAGLIDCESKLYSIVIPINRKNEKYWIEYDDPNQLRCDPVHLNDKCDLWMAVIVNTINYELIQDMGKKKRYNAIADIDIIGYSKVFREAPDYLTTCLSKIKDVTMKSFRPNSYDVLKRMTNVEDYNTQHDLFAINIDLIYKTDFCTSLTLTGQEACSDVY